MIINQKNYLTIYLRLHHCHLNANFLHFLLFQAKMNSEPFYLVSPFNHPSIHPFIHQSTYYLPIQSSIRPSNHLPVHTFVHPTTHLPIYLSIYPPIHYFIHSPIHSFIHPFIHSSTHPHRNNGFHLLPRHSTILSPFQTLITIITIITITTITNRLLKMNRVSCQ